MKYLRTFRLFTCSISAPPTAHVSTAPRAAVARAWAATALLVGLAGCGDEADVPPPAKPEAAARLAPTPDAKASDAAATQAAGPPAQGAARDPFANVDVAGDDTLRMIMRVGDRPRAADNRVPRPAEGGPPTAAQARVAEAGTATRAQGAPLTAPADVGATDGSAAAAVTGAAAPVSAPVAAPVAAPIAPATAAASVASSVASAEPARLAALRAIERAQPPFPPDARRDGITQGRVLAAITVLPNGTVGAVEVLQATPPRVFDRTVRNTLLRWRFEPVAQPTQATVELLFSDN